MKIVCDNCGTKYSIADEKVRGKVFKIRCKRCSHIIVVKGTENAAPGAFDQKETRVYEYGEGEGSAPGEAPAAGAGGGGDAVWHLVIDREQVGPMTAAEVRDRWQRSEVNKDTYAWREGMADWQRLAAITELAGVLGAAGGATAAGGFDAAPTAKADPGDLFGQGADEPAPQSDLFARAGMPTGSGSNGNGSHGDRAQYAATDAGAAGGGGDDLFGSSMRGGGGASAGGAGVEVPMTGQRNENSVLFSLNNLAAVASESPHRPSNVGFASSTGGKEGSGLIDIRAMAATTLGGRGNAGGGAPAARATDDDIPVFGTGLGGSVAPSILLPSTGGGVDSKKLMYIMVGSAALLGLIIAAAIVLTRGGGDDRRGDDRPAVAMTDDDPSNDRKDPEPAAAATKDADKKEPDKTEPPTPSADPTAGEGDTPGGETATADEPRDTGRTATTSRDRKDPPKKDRTPTPKTEPKEPKPASTSPATCDEVECLVDDSMPCCAKYKSKGSSPKSAPKADTGGGSEEKLSREDIKSGIGTVKGRVYACNDRFKQSGIVKVRIEIAASGKVSSAEVTGEFAGTPTGNCVESAVKQAKFKASGGSTTISYPFAFR